MCRNQHKWPTSLGFLGLFNFFLLCFFSFSYLFAAVVDLLLGWDCSQFKTFWESIIKTGNFYHEVATWKWSCSKFCSSFSLKFLSIFMHISGSIDHEPITLIWVSLERSVPPAKLEYKWCQLWSKLMMSEAKANARHGWLRPSTGVNGLNK